MATQDTTGVSTAWMLVAKWSASADDLEHTGDHYEDNDEATDDAMSKVYRECAQELRAALRANETVWVTEQ